MAEHPIPDDVATVLLRLVQEGGEIKVVEVLGDSEDGAVTFVLECKRTAASRALACVNKQFARLTKPCLRQLGREAYIAKASEANFPRERLAFVEWRD